MRQFWCFSGARYNPGAVTAASIVKALTVFAAIALLARRSARAHHPFPHFGPANQVTMIRASLVALVAGFIGEVPLPGAALIVVGAAVVATVLDGVDGWLARRTGMASVFGARFDMETDALLIQVLAILAWQYHKAGPWVLASGLLRYVFVAAGWVLPWLRRPLFPSFRRKAICIVQIVGLILTMLPPIVPPASEWLAAVSLGALVYSFLADTLWLSRQATRSRA
jgi:phosphatidylglycerophosphate synthase